MVATGLVWGSRGLCFRPYMTALEIFGILCFYTESVLTTYWALSLQSLPSGRKRRFFFFFF